jgi:proteic killer suppression protein
VVILDLLDAAVEPKDLAGVKSFHPLKGNLAGYYAMHVNGNWCITFRFDDADVTDLDLVDYH